MEFRRSQLGDLDQIVRIAEDAKAFLRSSGVNQWQRGTYPDRALFASVCDRCEEAGDPRVGYERILP